MCFSASASFGAGVVLSVIGVASIKRVEERSSIPFACIPLVFAVQQITEGFLWLALSNETYASLQQPATYLFLFFAQVVWPLWIPLSILLLEKRKERIILEKILLAMGVVVSAYFVYCLLTYHVEAGISGYHMAYQQNYPAALGWYIGLFYIIATILPALLSSVLKMWVLGIIILISYVVTIIFYKAYVVSVWCFFATIISLSVFMILNEMKKSNNKHIVTDSAGLLSKK